jgi:nucleoside-diphosphate-sugar epimerase
MAADRLKTVLLTGAGGFVGRHCTRHLEARGWTVHAERFDILDARETSAVIRAVKPDALLHLAWYAKHGLYWNANENFDWLNASVHLLREFIAAGGKRFVGAGTCAEYDWTHGHCDESLTPARPSTVYGACKLSLSAIAGALARREGIGSAWARLFFLYGPHEDPARFVPSVIRSLLAGRPAPCTSGEQVRDFLHVDDAAAALAALVDSDVQGPVNVASGTAVTLAFVAREIAKQTGNADLLQLGALPARAGDPPRLEASTKRLNEEVGWRPRYTLPAGIAETIRWYENYENRH